MSDFASASQLKDVKLRYDTVLTQVLPADIAVPLKAFGIETAEDLYECAANAGAGWFRPITGIDAERATALMHWLSRCGEDVGEVTERFFLPGTTQNLQAMSVATQASEDGIVPLERLEVPEKHA